MSHTESPQRGQPPSTLWLWGFWVCFAAATVAFVISLYAWFPLGQLFRVIAGLLLVVGGLHNGRVVTYLYKARGPYTIFGFDSYITQRQIGWSAIVLGAVFVASAFVGL